jgi:hypothetical protein
MWKGHLEIKHNSKDFADESFDVEDLRIDERALTFRAPRSTAVDNLSISFRGVCPARNTMQGIADTIHRGSDQDIHFQGTWSLHKVNALPKEEGPEARARESWGDRERAWRDSNPRPAA